MSNDAGIRVHAVATFHPERSDPRRNTWFFSYTVTITNDGPTAATLIDRHWEITDARGAVGHVRGPGVVGETPRLEPGDSFTYTSFCPLPTPFGQMTGSYGMLRDNGTRFDAEIPAFALEDPSAIQ
jgi:ApaG protein